MIGSVLSQFLSGGLLYVAVLEGTFAFPVNPLPAVPPISVSTKDINFQFKEETDNRPLLNFKGRVAHNAVFLPDLSLHSKTLLSTPVAGWISRDQGAQDSWLSPPVGSYHAGAIGYSDYVLNPVKVTAGPGLNNFRWDVTGQLRLGADAPKPSVTHGEYTSSFSNSTSIGFGGALAISPMGVRVLIDDGVTGSFNTPEATETDSLAIAIGDERFASLSDVVARFAYVSIDSYDGLRIASSDRGEVLLSFQYGLGEPDDWQGIPVTYLVTLANGVFNATENWKALWETTQDPSGHVISAFLPVRYVPSYQWWSSAGGEWAYDRSVEVTVTASVDEPSSIGLSVGSLLLLAGFHQRRYGTLRDGSRDQGVSAGTLARSESDAAM